ncbi:hypothetical protein [Nonomuraea solani]|uniref:hypothetical protein n=1 Tax=Nonomuraea solani TaxID=1144553 RepID=UPI00190E7D14|nr:hypothetical protein [Nonomuraea solani]
MTISAARFESVPDNRLVSWVTNLMVSVDVMDGPNVEALSEWLRTEAPLRDRPGGGCGFLSETTGQDLQWGGGKSPECTVWAGALNNADLPAVLDRVQCIAWRCPSAVQVFLMDQQEAYFRVWMLRDGTLQQYAPTVPDEKDEGFFPDDYG